VAALAADFGGDDEFGPYGELLELIAGGGPAWKRDALCREYAQLSWFPERGQPVAAQKAICGRCRARKDCLDYARSHGDSAGIRGGHTFVNGREVKPRRQRFEDVLQEAEQ
jgi:WhiB family redox-sensing transcriptional regulator